MNRKIRAYTIQLGRNMWCDRTGPAPVIEGYIQVMMPKYETFTKDKDTFRKLVNHAHSVGMNTIVINIGEGLTFESHPEINIEGSWTRDELKEEIEYIRALGMEPVPLMNFSATHDLWLGIYERMVATEEYYKVCADLIDEVCQVFDSPKYFHIGMDEENEKAQEFYNFATVRNEIVFCRDVNFFCDCIRKNGARPWMFTDSYLRFPDGFTESIAKDVIMSNQHSNFEGKTEKREAIKVLPIELEPLADAGYDIVLMSSSYRTSASPETATDYANKNISADRLIGTLCYTYLFCEYENYYKLLFEASNAAEQFEREAE